MTVCPIAHGYDPLDPQTVLDPYPVFNHLRAEGPVLYMPELDHYIVTRFDDVEQVLLDRDTWSASNASSPLLPVCPAAQEVLAAGYHRVPTLNNADPPRHGPMRKSVLTVMTPRRLNALEPTLRAYAEGLISGFIRRAGRRPRRPVGVPVPRATPRSACSASRPTTPIC